MVGESVTSSLHFIQWHAAFKWTPMGGHGWDHVYSTRDTGLVGRTHAPGQVGRLISNSLDHLWSNNPAWTWVLSHSNILCGMVRGVVLVVPAANSTTLLSSARHCVQHIYIELRIWEQDTLVQATGGGGGGGGGPWFCLFPIHSYCPPPTFEDNSTGPSHSPLSKFPGSPAGPASVDVCHEMQQGLKLYPQHRQYSTCSAVVNMEHAHAVKKDIIPKVAWNLCYTQHTIFWYGGYPLW